MSSERTGLILRGQLLKEGSREVTPKGSEPFTVYEVRLLSDARIHIVTFYNQEEMSGALRNDKMGQVVDVPVYGRAGNNHGNWKPRSRRCTSAFRFRPGWLSASKPWPMRNGRAHGHPSLAARVSGPAARQAGT